MKKIIEAKEDKNRTLELTDKLFNELSGMMSIKLRFLKSDVEFGDLDKSKVAKLDTINQELDRLIGRVKNL